MVSRGISQDANLFKPHGLMFLLRLYHKLSDNYIFKRNMYYKSSNKGGLDEIVTECVIIHHNRMRLLCLNMCQKKIINKNNGKHYYCLGKENV